MTSARRRLRAGPDARARALMISVTTCPALHGRWTLNAACVALIRGCYESERASAPHRRLDFKRVRHLALSASSTGLARLDEGLGGAAAFR